LSSPSPSPSPSADPAAPAVASPSTPASPATTPPAATTPPSTPAARPDWLPSDEYWDGEKNEIKSDLGKKFNEMATRIAADDVRKGSLPQTADAYKLELPADFKPPAGVEFKLDAANPALGQLKAVAHKHGMTQEAVNELIGVYAGNEVGTEARIKAAATAEVAKLGPSGPARVDAVTRFMDASGLGPLKSTLVTAAQVEAMEAHITKLTTQGSAPYSNSHRVPPDTNAIPNYDKMSFAQRRQAQDELAARRRA
jgi:hypothetical protein